MLLNIVNLLPLFTIVLFRTASVLFFSPVFNQTGLPLLIKIGLALVIALVIFPTVSDSQQMLPDGLLPFILLVFKEIAIGFVIGYGATLTFGAFVVAGDLISGEMGLQMAQMVDPIFGGHINPIAQLLQMLGLILFLALDGHHWIINALVLSYKTVPISEFFESGMTMGKIMQLFHGLFVSAIKIAAPIMIILFLVVIVAGLIGKAIPEINIMMLVFPMKIMVGFIVLGITFPFIVRAMEYVINILRKDLYGLAGGM
ncbi:MAG: flagellar biosynthetic protein FliR [Candidatus Scalindua sp.]